MCIGKSTILLIIYKFHKNCLMWWLKTDVVVDQTGNRVSINVDHNKTTLSTKHLGKHYNRINGMSQPSMDWLCSKHLCGSSKIEYSWHSYTDIESSLLNRCPSTISMASAVCIKKPESCTTYFHFAYMSTFGNPQGQSCVSTAKSIWFTRLVGKIKIRISLH